MPRNRATQRRTPIDGSQAVSVQDFFFRRLADGTMELRQDTVTRAELWGALEWYHKKAIELNRPWKRFWRMLTGKPVHLNPFQIIYVARTVKKAGKQIVGSNEEAKAENAKRGYERIEGPVAPRELSFGKGKKTEVEP